MTSDNKLRHNWEDPLFFDRCLSEDEVIVRNMARNYCTEKLMPRVQSAYSEERFDKEIFTEMGKLGLLGLVGNELSGHTISSPPRPASTIVPSSDILRATAMICFCAS